MKSERWMRGEKWERVGREGGGSEQEEWVDGLEGRRGGREEEGRESRVGEKEKRGLWRRRESESVYRYYAFCQLGSRMLRNNISLIAQSEGLLLLSTHKQNNITNNLLGSVVLKQFV